MKRYINVRWITPAVILLVIALIPTWVHSPYYLDLLIVLGINTVLAITFVLTLRAGMINVAPQVFWGIGAYASAILVMKVGMSFWLSMPLAAIIAGLVAFGYSFLALQSVGFRFIILGLIMSMIFVVAVGNINFLGGYSGISLIPPPNAIGLPGLPMIQFDNKTEFFYLVLFLLVLVVLAYTALYNSSIGRAWRAIGLNSNLAATLGINVFRYRTLAWVTANATCGLMGAFYAHYQGFITPTIFTLFKGLYIGIYAILGGVGQAFSGPAVGSFIMLFFPELMRVTREIEPIITGVLIIVVIAFLPRGVLSLPGLRNLVADPFNVAENLGKAIKSNLSLLSRRGEVKR